METEERVEAYLDDLLSAEDRAQFESDLEQDAALKEALQAELEVRDALTIAGKAQILEQVKAIHAELPEERRRPPVMRIAASVLMLVGLGIAVFVFSNRNPDYQQLAMANYETPDWNVSRGAADSTFEAVHQAYTSGNYQQAHQLLAPLLNDADAGPQAHYYAGHVYWAQKQLPKAQHAFEYVVDSGSLLTQLAQWNLALVLLQQRQPAQAAEQLEQVHEGGGNLAEKASKLLESIQ